MTVVDISDLELKFGGRLVEQLGAQMYPSATATVAELISNAWDADARNVWVEMPFDNWFGGEIVVTDDGSGMSLSEAQEAYLIVGRNRRLGGKQRTALRDRLVHGRKGIGKLAAFGTATILEVKTRKLGAPEIAFRLDYDKIRVQPPDVAYQVEPSADLGALSDPVTGEPLPQGTRIKLSGLRGKRRLNPDQFTSSMSRRFALDDHEMAVFINGERLRRFDIDLQFRFPPDRLPAEARHEDGWAREELGDGRPIKWWIGFTPKPLKDDAQQGISVVVRGKLAQRPFKFESSGGTQGQLGQEYLVGEVEADWIDDEYADSTNDNDYIQSNRDQLQLEDEDLAEFLEWGRRRLRWALSAWDGLKREQQEQHLQKNAAMERLLAGRSKREKDALNRVAAAVARLPEAEEKDVVRVMEAVIGARDEGAARSIAHEIALAGAEPEELFPLIRELAHLDAKSAIAFIDARLETLAQLALLDPGDAFMRAFDAGSVGAGLLDPTWALYRAEKVEGPADVEIVFITPVVDMLTAVAVLLVPRGTPHTDVELAKSKCGEREVLVVAAEPDAVPGASSWSDFIARSAERHTLWREVVGEIVALTQS